MSTKELRHLETGVVAYVCDILQSKVCAAAYSSSARRLLLSRVWLRISSARKPT